MMSVNHSVGRTESLTPDKHQAAGVIQMLAQASADVGLLRDGDPVDGLMMEEVWTEPFMAVLPRRHPLARRKVISAAQLRDEPFVLFPRTMGERAYEKTLSLCEERGYRPQVVQEAPQWLTILRLVGAGLGVSLAPACVAPLAPPDAVCRRLQGATARSAVELAHRTDDERSVVRAFAKIARESFRAAAR